MAGHASDSWLPLLLQKVHPRLHSEASADLSIMRLMPHIPEQTLPRAPALLAGVPHAVEEKEISKIA